MRRVHPRPTRRVRVAVALVAALLTAAPAAALAPPTDPLAPKVNPSPDTPAAGRAPADTTLYLMLRTGPKETEQAILETISKGLAAQKTNTAGKPTIRSISPAVYAELTALVNQATDGPTVESAGGASVKPMLTRDTLFEVKIDSNQTLKTFRVTYQKAGPKDYAPTAAGAAAPLVLIVPGRYAFRPEAGDTPTAYELVVADLGKPDATIKAPWPVSDKFFVVTVRNFSGNKEELFKVIQDPDKVANPLDNVQVGSDFLFAFAGLNSSAGKARGGIREDNTLELYAEKIEKRSVKRVWALFPLDEKGLADQKDKLGKLSGGQLSAEVRKANPVRVTDEGLAGKAFPQVAPADPAKWYELLLPKVVSGSPGQERTTLGDTFQARVRLTDLPAMAAKYPNLWTLYVWEFDDGSQQEAIQVQVPNTDDRAYFLPREQPNWQRNVSDAIKRAPAPKKE